MKYFIILIIIIIGGIIWQQSGNQPTPPDTEVTIEEQLEPTVSFSIKATNYSYSQKEVRVKKGDVVKIDFSSTLGFHDFNIDEFDVHTKTIRPGTLTSVMFVADMVGEFEYYCSTGNHREQGMVGTLVVTE